MHQGSALSPLLFVISVNNLTVWNILWGRLWLDHTTKHPFNGFLSGTTRVSQYQKGKTNLDFTEARDSEWQWNPLGHIQVCTSLQTDNHASTPPLSVLQAECPSCRPTNSVKALKATQLKQQISKRRYYLAAHRRVVNVLSSNSAFLIFAVLLVWSSHSRPYKMF